MSYLLPFLSEIYELNYSNICLEKRNIWLEGDGELVLGKLEHTSLGTYLPPC